MENPRAAALHDRGGLHKMAGRLDAAEADLREALRLAPGNPLTRHALGIVLLSQGRYQDGWPLYEARHEIASLHNPKPDLPYREWRGEPLAGRRLLIFPEQGFGDQIMFARFAAVARDQGADVTLLCPPPLVRLFRSIEGIRVVPAAGAAEFPDPGYWVMSSSIAWRFGVTPDTIPASPYLCADPPRPLGAARIGVVTRGNPRHANDANRSLPPDVAARLLATPGAVSLLPEDTGFADFYETAQAMIALERIITVDTAAAHLAGALGRPVNILVPSVMTDWRWMEGRADSPWYPTARLLRSASAGGHASVFTTPKR